MTYVDVSIGQAFGNSLLSTAFIGRSWWLALHPTDPGPLGDPSSELAGGGYERQDFTFAAPASKTILSVGSLIFDGLPAAHIYYLGVWSAFTGGTLAFAIPLATYLAPNASNQILVAPGDVAFSLP